ncbi:Protein GMH1 [Spathaspora sp. JA1]|nr:Protein GMH1 [Spathaspora sp. JA1]
MSKRVNLPYTTQDLFPQSVATPTASRFGFGGGGSTTAGSIISGTGTSSIYTPRLNYTSNLPSANTISHGFTSKFRNLRVMIKRLFKPATLDFETAIWEIFNLIINPRKMYRSHYFYKQQQGNISKSSYTRDDPSFLILLTGFLSISAIAWGLAYSPRVIDILKLIGYMVFIDFYLTGVIIASITWFISNRLFNMNQYSVNYIEWGFCFDIHCNSFLVIWGLLYVVQFILLPIITLKHSIIGLIIGNSLYFGSIGYYFIITFYGFNSLPFISNNSGDTSTSSPAKLLQLIVIAGILPLLAIGWLITIIVRFNVADIMVDTYFN